MHKLWFVLLMLSDFGTAAAGVYRWQDENGNPHFSDRPRQGAERVTLKPGYAFLHVEHVYDGDTILLVDGRRVRLLGINTPEVEGRNKSEEAGGEQAKRWLMEALKDTRIRLVEDTEKLDKYGRFLAHVFTERNRHVNLELVRQGLAAVNIYPPNLQYTDALVAAQEEAEAAGRGIWSRPEYAPKPSSQISNKNGKGWQRVTGQVTALRTTRKFVYLKFTDRFDVRIERKNLALFPDINGYVGKAWEVRGWLNRSKNHFSMLIRHPSAIKNLSAQQSPSIFPTSGNGRQRTDHRFR